MSSDKKDILTAEKLRSTDAELKNLPVDKYGKLASDDVLAKTKAKLEAVGHKVTICDTAADAVKLLGSLVPDGASVSAGASTTLDEIGFWDHMKSRTNIKNYRAISAECRAKNDFPGLFDACRQGMSADYFFSSVSAIATTGEIVGADLTGTRVGAWTYSAKHVILVTGTQKIVPTKDDALKRLYDYQLPLESARCRIVYKTPGSTVANLVVLGQGSPYTKERIHVVFIKAALGY